MKRGSLRADEEFLRERAAKQARWVGTLADHRAALDSIKRTESFARSVVDTVNKYRNEKTDGYDSRREAKRAADLRMLQAGGYISELREQVPFLLIPAQYIDGKCVERACTYTADFVYKQDGATVVEDAKGYPNDRWPIKRKLMLFVHGVRVVEV